MTEVTKPTEIREIPDGWREWNEVDALRYELRRAVETVRFLHCCLTNPRFKYAYPQQTLDRIEVWKPLVASAPDCTATTARHPEGVCPVHHRLMPVVP